MRVQGWEGARAGGCKGNCRRAVGHEGGRVQVWEGARVHRKGARLEGHNGTRAGGHKGGRA